MPVRAKKRKPVKIEEEKGGIQKILLWGVGALGVLGLGALLFLAVRGPAAPKEVDIDGVASASGQSREHLNGNEETAVTNLPPMGGSHSAAWQNCGIYDTPIDADNAAHSLEHGAVWIAYQPDLPEDDVNQLQRMTRGESHILLAPFPDLQSPIVLTAWGLQLEADSAADGRVSDFIDEYQQGPQTPEPGATCRDGVGTPIE